MSTSRGILPRALPSSNRRGTPPRPLRVLLALLAGLAAWSGPAPSAAGQEIDFSRYAILERGPEPGRGIDELSPNVIPHWRASYLVAGTGVTLYYIRGVVAGADALPRAECTRRTLRRSSPAVLYYQSDGTWSIVAVAAENPAAAGAGDAAAAEALLCRFLDSFIDRFLYFEQTTPVPRGGERAPAMPAIVELK